jgi:CheY-like chemotaxis protein
MVKSNDTDLILSNINMPVLSGLDFSRNLKATPEISSVPVIAFTANDMVDGLKRINEAGLSEILFKPFRERDFIEKISLFLQ